MTVADVSTGARRPPLPLLLVLACATVSSAAVLHAPRSKGDNRDNGLRVGGKPSLREARMRFIEMNRLILQRPFVHAHGTHAHWPHAHRPLHEPHGDPGQQLDALPGYDIDGTAPELLLEMQSGQPPGLLLPEPALAPGSLPASGVLPVPLAHPAPFGPHGGDQKLEISLGPCVLQLYEPCTDSGTIIFYLFSSVDGRPAVLSVEDPQLPEIFDPDLPTKVLIHGFAGSVDFNFTSSVRQAYLLRGGYNVLVVDWGRLTQLPCYPSSVLNTWQVSRCAGQLLSGLARLSPSLQPRHLHAVGFSLGAHIAAYLSAELLALTGQRLGRITGLDPALPAFASLSNSWKLDRSDAAFVDVIHTNAGVLGKVEPTGHADFYVNGGTVQPFCTGGDRNIPLCSHLLAPVYFSETILDEAAHWGRDCPSYGHYAWGLCPTPTPDQLPHTPWTRMGEGADQRVHGTFLVETAAEYPFALGPPTPNPPLPQPTSGPPDTIYVVLSQR